MGRKFLLVHKLREGDTQWAIFEEIISYQKTIKDCKRVNIMSTSVTNVYIAYTCHRYKYKDSVYVGYAND